ncbi:MAG: HAMP domain-containing histidine kinase, partial [Arcobacter butzleri]|nr:HAMP domain-containing histidine kinase [Aliarcobacter butzleri]
TTASSGLKLKQEFGLITPNDIDEFNKSILEHANYLSKTIDDFRNFFKESKEIEKFDIKRLIDSSTKLVESSYKHSHIDLKVNIIDNTFVNSYFREAMQAMINLLNNAKDAVISNNEEVKVVLVDVFRQNNDLVISIQDNGGGILDEIKEKIFEPYFTTKHQSQGTGIGLYMSSEIVSKHLKGKITVENKTFWYGNKEYFGANFRVFLPLDNKVEI